MKTQILLDHDPVADGGHVVRALLRITGEAPEASDRPALNLSLVLDRSGSMQGLGKLDWAKEAASLLVRRVGDDDVVSVVAYDDDVRTVAGRTTLVDGLEADGLTGDQVADIDPVVEPADASVSTDASDLEDHSTDEVKMELIPIGLAIVVIFWIATKWHGIRAESAVSTTKRAMDLAKANPLNDDQLVEWMDDSYRADNHELLSTGGAMWDAKFRVAGTLWDMTRERRDRTLLKFIRERCHTFEDVRIFVHWADAHFSSSDYFDSTRAKSYRPPPGWL